MTSKTDLSLVHSVDGHSQSLVHSHRVRIDELFMLDEKMKGIFETYGKRGAPVISLGIFRIGWPIDVTYWINGQSIQLASMHSITASL